MCFSSYVIILFLDNYTLFGPASLMREAGLKFLASAWLPPLCIGVTFMTFISSGNMPCQATFEIVSVMVM